MDSSRLLLILCTKAGLNYQNNIGRIEASITWQIIVPDGTIDTDAWRRELSRHARFTDDEIEQIFEGLPILTDMINQAEIETVRWLCHGHIGFKFLWFAFARCIYDVTDGEINLRTRTTQEFLSSQYDIRFNLCGRSLAQASINGTADYPSRVFELLGLAIP